MVSPARLGHLVLKVRDIAESERFYTEVLGLTVTSREMGMVFLTSGSNASHELALAPAVESRNHVDGRHVGLSHFAWQMRSFGDLRKIQKQLERKGVNILGTGDHGISIGVYFADPDGNRVEVFYEMPRRQWPKEHLFSGKFPTKLTDDQQGNKECKKGGAK